MRRIFLWAARNAWLRDHLPRMGFMRRAVRRFMPGETMESAMDAAAPLQAAGIGTMYTKLGENLESLKAADAVADHYIAVLDAIKARGLNGEISVKPTQLGLDLDPALCAANVRSLVERAKATGNFVWIDMEQSRYTDATLALCLAMRALGPQVGVCVQAYLRRTPHDVEALIAGGAGIRLVKGAYKEPPAVAFPAKSEVDARYLDLACRLLSDDARRAGVRAVFGTHDPRLLAAIRGHAAGQGLDAKACEFHLLYGIQRAEQERLARAGHRVSVLISYGSYWFPWYMRRLAERPANVLFVLKSLFRA